MTPEQSINHATSLLKVSYAILEDILESTQADMDDKQARNNILTMKRAITSIHYARNLLESNL